MLLFDPSIKGLNERERSLICVVLFHFFFFFGLIFDYVRIEETDCSIDFPFLFFLEVNQSINSKAQTQLQYKAL